MEPTHFNTWIDFCQDHYVSIWILILLAASEIGNVGRKKYK